MVFMANAERPLLKWQRADERGAGGRGQFAPGFQRFGGFMNYDLDGFARIPHG